MRLLWDPLQSEERRDGLAVADDVIAFTVDKNFSGSRSTVVVAGHRETVSSRASHAEPFTSLNFRELTVAREEITGLTDRTDDIDLVRGRTGRSHGLDRMPCVVERGSDRVVHAGVDDHELFPSVLLVEQTFPLSLSLSLFFPLSPICCPGGGQALAPEWKETGR